MSLASNASYVVNAFTSGTFPECDGTAGPCVDKWSKGFVFFPNHQKCNSGFILLPGYGLLPEWLLAVTWLLFMLYLFFGAALSADLFCAAIEVIVETTWPVQRTNANGELVTVNVKVWNPAVANLSLLAVGTSAPEILLALIESLLHLGQPAERLGPSTIVGSAAYNLLGIVAVCIVVIPTGTYKTVAAVRVFAVSAAWSVWAYVWMIIVYIVWTPDRITLTEALLTLAQFVCLAVSVWMVERRIWRGYKWVDDELLNDAEAPLTLVKVKPSRVLPEVDGSGVRPVSTRISTLEPGSIYDTNKYRRSALKSATARRIANPDSAQLTFPRLTSLTELRQNDDFTRQMVHFKSKEYAVLESAGTAIVNVVRYGGDVMKKVSVSYATKDHTAVAGIDYVATTGTLLFEPGETLKPISIPIIDDQNVDDDVSFFVSLVLLEGDALVAQPAVEVTIIDQDDAGAVDFTLPHYELPAINGVVEIPVERRKGAAGTITVDYTTQEATAMAGIDFQQTTGQVTFGHGEVLTTIKIPVFKAFLPYTHKVFKLALSSGSKELLGKRTQCTVTISEHKVVVIASPTSSRNSSTSITGRRQPFMMRMAWYTQWMEQLKQAIIPKATDDDGKEVEPGPWFYILHAINMPWKIFMSIVPPPEYRGGYPCFFTAMAFLGCISFLLQQVANLFGCAVGLNQLMTGITFVAVGTSIPDTFASMYVALHSPTADAAIGNTFGGNSSNIFLGMGVPWTISAVYAAIKGQIYHTPAGDLAFSTTIYIAVAVPTILLLFARHYFLGGELGGAFVTKWIHASFLWAALFLYLIISGLQSYGNIPSFDGSYSNGQDE